MLRSWFLPEAPWMPLGFFIHFNIAMPFSSLQLGLDWGSMRNFVTFEWNLYIFDHIVLTVSISIFWLINARGTNVRQFPTRNNFLIINILSCLSVISFYFPPLEVVHPVSFDTGKMHNKRNNEKKIAVTHIDMIQDSRVVHIRLDTWETQGSMRFQIQKRGVLVKKCLPRTSLYASFYASQSHIQYQPAFKIKISYKESFLTLAIKLRKS